VQNSTKTMSLSTTASLQFSCRPSMPIIYAATLWALHLKNILYTK